MKYFSQPFKNIKNNSQLSRLPTLALDYFAHCCQIHLQKTLLSFLTGILGTLNPQVLPLTIHPASGKSRSFSWIVSLSSVLNFSYFSCQICSTFLIPDLAIPFTHCSLTLPFGYGFSTIFSHFSSLPLLTTSHSVSMVRRKQASLDRDKVVSKMFWDVKTCLHYSQMVSLSYLSSLGGNKMNHMTFLFKTSIIPHYLFQMKSKLHSQEFKQLYNGF